MKKIAIIMLAILTSLLFINCSADSGGKTASGEPANELVGTWQGVGNELTLQMEYGFPRTFVK